MLEQPQGAIAYGKGAWGQDPLGACIKCREERVVVLK